MSNDTTHSKRIIIRIALNSYDIPAKSSVRLTAAWINARLDIFWNYTLKSLKAQTNQDFDVFVDCSKDSEILPTTFLAQRDPLPSNIHFNCGWDSDFAIDEIAKHYDWLYITRLDSDDLYKKTFVENLYNLSIAPTTQAIVCQDGYLYDIKTQTLKTYFDFSPPFYTFVYPTSDYLLRKRYQLTPNLGHASVIHVLQYEILPGANYMVTVHTDNTGTTSDSPLAKKTLSAAEREAILPQFGLDL